MSESKTEIILALDVEDRKTAHSVLRSIGDQLKWVKIGLQSYLRDGPDLIKYCKDNGKDIFLDLKLHDIPNTMAKAIESLASLPVKMITLHSCSGPEALARCTETAKEVMPETIVLGVTVLTSMNQENLFSVGINSTVKEQVLRLANLAKDSGIGGLVCSPLELSTLRPILPSSVKLVTPGIRPSGSAVGDQKRIMNPRDAQKAGADFLVIGRPILSAADPSSALNKILKELE
ncbi:MAG: orotidine-5'-phosphate decarboxylase [Opitutae bacterium]|nr:orotidine-5'-phosphate decarboxylase [Opitutae bacterium]